MRRFATPLPARPGISPLLGPLAVERLPESKELNALLGERHCNAGGLPIRFVDGDAAGAGAAGADFEARIWQRGEVAMRADSWHDAFNALAWVAYPQAKRELNRLHMLHGRGPQDLAPSPAAGSGSRRGTARDVLTLFDEDGIIVACADAQLAELLTGFCWKELFWRRREAVMQCMRFHVFGHALADKLRAPFRGLTAKALLFAVDRAELALPLDAQVAAMDARAAHWFSLPQALASTRVFSPLPVLGIPGWHRDNALADYYDDAWQFRPGRGAQGVHSGA